MIQDGESTAIVVDRSWAYRKMIRIYLGPNDGGGSSAEGSGDSHLVIADVLSSSDPRGLWIALNPKKQKWPDSPEYRMMIPWQHVLAVIVNPKADPESRQVGFVPSPDRIKAADMTSQKPKPEGE